MRLSELIEKPVAPDPEITGLSADSRAVRPGYLFAALPGVAADGADFIPNALAAGAVAVLAAEGVRLAPGEAALVTDANPRLKLALCAARFYGAQPRRVLAVTGTNGKTSIAHFAAQLWGALGETAASMGTLGVRAPGYDRPLRHTTPDPVEVHEVLADLAANGVDRLALEASSHGLAQYRLDGVRLRAAGFANITQDHLDYHPTFDDYLAAKLRLLTEVLPGDGVAVVNADGAGAGAAIEAVRARGIALRTVGAAGEALRLIEQTPHAGGQSLRVAAGDGAFDLDLPLIGGFQASNALMACALVAACEGRAESELLPHLAKLTGAPGRMQKVGERAGAAVYVDYAHTPDALATVLQAARGHAAGRLMVVFGAGGDRDAGKRPLMGAAVAAHADAAIVTDDNPRSEDPAAIRRAVLKGCPTAEEIGDRAAAIRAAVRRLGAGDVLIIAGKGHETGQIVGDETRPFDDAAEARGALAEVGETQ